ncbi:MAG: glycosyltransferase [Bacteroidales bacterium]|nr:glycosyltransferase [Bacteroidales bacterium]
MNTRLFFIDECNSSRYNGIGTFRNTLLRGLYKSYESVTLISLNSDCEKIMIDQRYYGQEFRIPYIAQGQWRYNGVLIVSSLRMLIDDDSNNIFIVNHSPSSAFITEMKRQFPHSKFIFVIHNQGWCTQLLGDSRLLRRIIKDATDIKAGNSIIEYFREEQQIYSLVDAVVCLSMSTYKIVRNVYNIPSEKCHLIVNGIPRVRTKIVDRESIRRQLGIRPDEKIIIFAGRPTQAKGFNILLGAIKKLIKNTENVRCVVAGSISGVAEFEPELASIASDLIFTGHLSAKDLKKWYVASDIGVIPSYSEQCSYSALEMMRMGLIIVSSDGNGICDMFSNYKNAFVYKIAESSNVSARNLSHAITEAMMAPREMTESMIEFNHHLINTRFSLAAMYDNYRRLFSYLQNM